MKRRTFITRLASELTELASFSPMEPHCDSQKCITHIIISRRRDVIPNFAHLTEKLSPKEKGGGGVGVGGTGSLADGPGGITFLSPMTAVVSRVGLFS